MQDATTSRLHGAMGERLGRHDRWAWALGLALLALVVAVAFRLSDAREFAEIAAARAEPWWFVGAVLLQVSRHDVAQGEIFRDVARAGAAHLQVATVYRVSLMKLFMDQALPSAGLDGRCSPGRLQRAGMPRPLVAASVVVSIASYQLAYASSLLLAWRAASYYGAGSAALAVTVSVFAALAALWCVILLSLAGRRPGAPATLLRIRALRAMLNFMTDAQPELSHSVRLLGLASGWQLSIILLDATTLWVLIRSLGVHASAGAVFASFMLATFFARSVYRPADWARSRPCRSWR